MIYIVCGASANMSLYVAVSCDHIKYKYYTISYYFSKYSYFHGKYSTEYFNNELEHYSIFWKEAFVQQ